ncbi:MAG TPA: class I SAM-dependent methyltransferase [Acetobacteraceae bacterium]|jgi:SAM-dependent methyltransferase|nr:class I SAM-dependent methyltransferase [Acetobacteraceae bacterium]
MTGELPDANEGMRHYWNNVAGPRWVAGQGFRERRNQESLTLLLACLRLTGGESVLEIGCGTGAVTLPLAQAVGEHGRVVAVDIAEPMLGVARQRLAESGMRNVTLLLGDAQVMPLERSAFDVVISRMGVMFFADPVAAFRNMAGALKPGGRLVFACWAPLEENQHWRISYDIALRHLGTVTSDDAKPGPLAFADPDCVRRILAEAGFVEIAIARAHPTIIGGTAEEEACQALMMGPTARLIEAKQPPEGTRRVIADEIAAAFAAEASAGPIRLSATIFLVTARRP